MYVRQIENQTLTFLVSGRLWRNSLIMTDVETGSFWSHITGSAVEGPRKGSHLQTVPVLQTTWGEWFRAHPETRVLKKQKAVTSSHYERYFKDPNRTGLFRTYWLQDRLPGKEIVLGLSYELQAAAVTEEYLARKRLLQFELGEYPVLVLASGEGGAKAFLARLSGRKLRFEKSGNELIEEKTQSRWDPETGVCLTGEWKGKSLKELSLTPVFWFAWSNFYPNTLVIDGSDKQ